LKRLAQTAGWAVWAAYPAMAPHASHIDDIIAREAATGPPKDRESLPRLQAFRLYLREQGRA
jgi:hypothetical protein